MISVTRESCARATSASMVRSCGPTPSRGDSVPPRTWESPLGACARSSAQRSATSATTTMMVGSRRGSVHTVQGFWVSILPQILQTWILSIATCSAAESGVINASRFLIRCSAARRAERGPSPGSRARSWIRRSISGPATAEGISGEAQPRRQAQSAGQRLHLFLHRGLCLAPRVVMRGHQQVVEDLALIRLHQRRVDLDGLDFHLRGHAYADEASTGEALDFDMAEFFLHRLHLRLELGCLLHYAEKISNGLFLVSC